MSVLGPTWLLAVAVILAVLAVPFLGFCWWALRAFPVPDLVDIERAYRRVPMVRDPSPIMVGDIPNFWASAVAVTSYPVHPMSAYMPQHGQTIWLDPSQQT